MGWVVFFWVLLVLQVAGGLIDDLQQSHGVCWEEERLALLRLRPSFPGLHWHQYNLTSDCCSWDKYKIVCNNSTGRVIQLSLGFSTTQALSTLNASATLDDHLSSSSYYYLNASLFLPFQHLTALYLFNNFIAGCLPNEGFERLSNLRNLETLVLSRNYFNNSVLTSLGHISSLTILDLSGNSLNGTLHLHEFAGLNNLEELYLGVCRLRNLRILDMSHSKLNGNLPACFSNLTALESLEIPGNELSGDLKYSPLGALHSIQSLSLSGNSFKVPISLAPFLNLSKLRFLFASDNEIYDDTEFHQSIPTFQLLYLYLSGHQLGLGGAFPNFLYHQHELELVYLSNTHFSGQKFPSWLLENNPNLGTILLANASLSGSFTLPPHPHQGLSYLHISNNLLVGGIPQEIGAFFPNLQLINMSNNQLIGSIPSSIGDMKSLRSLDLSNNNLSAGIPPWIANMTHIQNIILSDNGLEGPIPEKLFNMPFLKVLDLSGNLISGRIPSHFNLPYVTDIYLSRNKFEGSLPNSLCKSMGLTILDLSNNLFTDAIPRCINELQALTYLILKNNSFRGELPLEICELTRLSVIDLSYNNLSGSIPPCLNVTVATADAEGKRFVMELNRTTVKHLEFRTKSMSYSYKGRQLSFLSGIDLSCNKITGSIPEEIDEAEDDGFMDMDVFYISFIASYLTTFLTGLLVLWINPDWNREWFNYVETVATGCYYYVVDHMPKCF